MQKNCARRLEKGRQVVVREHLAKQQSRCRKCGLSIELLNSFKERRYGFGSLLYIQFRRVNDSRESKRSLRGMSIWDENTKLS